MTTVPDVTDARDRRLQILGRRLSADTRAFSEL